MRETERKTDRMRKTLWHTYIERPAYREGEKSRSDYKRPPYTCSPFSSQPTQYSFTLSTYGPIMYMIYLFAKTFRQHLGKSGSTLHIMHKSQYQAMAENQWWSKQTNFSWKMVCREMDNLQSKVGTKGKWVLQITWGTEAAFNIPKSDLQSCFDAATNAQVRCFF